jgi:hypothetical protein
MFVLGTAGRPPEGGGGGLAHACIPDQGDELSCQTRHLRVVEFLSVVTAYRAHGGGASTIIL